MKTITITINGTVENNRTCLTSNMFGYELVGKDIASTHTHTHVKNATVQQWPKSEMYEYS